MSALFEIRRCQPHDFDSLVVLLEQLWPDKELDIPSIKRVLDRALASKSQIHLCAVADNKLVGFVSLTIKNNLWQAGNLGHIDELVVTRECRGRGLGTQLLDAIVAQAREGGCSRVELDSAFHRKEAHRFYQQHEFENRAYLFSRKL